MEGPAAAFEHGRWQGASQGWESMQHPAGRAAVEVEGQAGGTEGIEMAALRKTQPFEPLAMKDVAHVAHGLQGRPAALPCIDLEARHPHDGNQIVMFDGR